jgi:hypothetical protein
VTAGLPADVAAARGIPAPDLAVLTGAAPCEVARRTTGTGLGELIADGRRLISDLMRRTVDLAGALRTRLRRRPTGCGRAPDDGS